MEPLTEKQRKVLEFVAARLQEDHPPSQREIAGHFKMAQNAAYQLVGYLRKKGYLVDVGGHRGLRLSPAYLDETADAEGLPILGRVAAGEPILAEQNIEGYMTLEKLFRCSKGTFALRVSGDSMVDEGIMDGDYVIVASGSKIEDGQIGVVLLDAAQDETVAEQVRGVDAEDDACLDGAAGWRVGVDALEQDAVGVHRGPQLSFSECGGLGGPSASAFQVISSLDITLPLGRVTRAFGPKVAPERMRITCSSSRVA